MTKIPCSKSCLDIAIAVAVSPTMMGQIAVGDSRTSNLVWVLIWSRQYLVMSRSFWTRCGSFMSVRIAVLALAATVTGRALLKRVGRPRWMMRSMSCCEPAMKPPAPPPSPLPRVPVKTSTRPLSGEYGRGSKTPSVCRAVTSPAGAGEASGGHMP